MCSVSSDRRGEALPTGKVRSAALLDPGQCSAITVGVRWVGVRPVPRAGLAAILVASGKSISVSLKPDLQLLARPAWPAEVKLVSCQHQLYQVPSVKSVRRKKLVLIKADHYEKGKTGRHCLLQAGVGQAINSSSDSEAQRSAPEM